MSLCWLCFEQMENYGDDEERAELVRQRALMPRILPKQWSHRYVGVLCAQGSSDWEALAVRGPLTDESFLKWCPMWSSLLGVSVWVLLASGGPAKGPWATTGGRLATL